MGLDVWQTLSACFLAVSSSSWAFEHIWTSFPVPNSSCSCLHHVPCKGPSQVSRLWHDYSVCLASISAVSARLLRFFGSLAASWAIRYSTCIQHVFNMYSTIVMVGTSGAARRWSPARFICPPGTFREPQRAQHAALAFFWLWNVVNLHHLVLHHLASSCIILHHLASKTVPLHNIEPGFKLWTVPVGYFLETQTRNQGCIDLVFVLHVVLASWFALLSFFTHILDAVILLLVFRCV